MRLLALIRWSRWLGCGIGAGIEIRRIEIILPAIEQRYRTRVDVTVSKLDLAMAKFYRSLAFQM
jgi:hypothetical protein